MPLESIISSDSLLAACLSPLAARACRSSPFAICDSKVNCNMGQWFQAKSVFPWLHLLLCSFIEYSTLKFFTPALTEASYDQLLN
ncbi:hypothetical protein F0562_029444 [Nyssa sinensis]|uniref:Uncharacterized protein n=1 Tax=Nyssa sinensis TaxID=561372 RepID=A0A5J5B434_9ASTE|nr:hypothetical protein F0562_029444 [Nyssa sinensis]